MQLSPKEDHHFKSLTILIKTNTTKTTRKTSSNKSTPDTEKELSKSEKAQTQLPTDSTNKKTSQALSKILRKG